MSNFEIFRVLSLKNGSGIHIKKKNRGKFTDYCGGQVTDKCIQRGKNSSNPTTRKRAIFADNARNWKHHQGGIINPKSKLISYNKNGKTIELPEVVVTPRGNYVQYQETVTNKPTEQEYVDAKLQQIRTDAANNFINQNDGIMPKGIPYQSLPSMLLGYLGMSDEQRIKRFGEEDREGMLFTCLNTGTNMYGLPELIYYNNDRFVEDSANHKTGFEQIPNDTGKIGDLIILTGKKGKDPKHAAMITGFDKNGNSVITYSNGDVKDAVVKDVDDWYSKHWKGEEYNTYRLVGKPETLNNIKLEYRSKFKQGGRLIPKYARGSPVNNNPLPKDFVNNNPIPNQQINSPLPKKKKLQIRPDFKNERPTPGMITFPVVGFKQN